MLKHNWVISSFLIAVLFSSCTEENTTDTHEELQAVVEPEVTIEAWQGNIDGNIPVLMWYSKTKGILYGELLYTNQKEPKAIKIIGAERDGDKYRILEFMPDGMITGIWALTPQVSSVEGEWFSPTTRKMLGTSLMHIDTAVTIHDISTTTTVDGVYSYLYGTDGNSGYLEVKRIDSNNIEIDFQNVTGPPAHNMAFLKDTVIISNNVAAYSNDEFGQCSFSISFYNDFAIVEYNNGKKDCGFGHNAFVDGIYLKK